jgi:hypothetical protein
MIKMPYLYFRSKLNSDGQTIYDKVMKSVLALEPSCQFISNMNLSEIEQITENILQDNPQIFYIDGISIQYFPGKFEVIPNYRFANQEIVNLTRACDKRADQIISRCSKKEVYATLIALHDILVRNVTYSNDSNYSIHTISSVLTRKLGVCEGIAKTFKYLLDRVNIPSIVVYGNAYSQVHNTQEPHAWNLVKIDTSWCHFDVTFDTTIRLNESVRYDYFALTDNEIKSDHIFDQNTYPVANNPLLSYYYKNQLIMNSREEFTELLAKSYSAGIKDIIVKLPGKVSENGIQEKVTQSVVDYFRSINVAQNIRISANPKQRVFQILLA